jgi:hypothetical protein
MRLLGCADLISVNRRSHPALSFTDQRSAQGLLFLYAALINQNSLAFSNQYHRAILMACGWLEGITMWEAARVVPNQRRCACVKLLLMALDHADTFDKLSSQ